MMYIDVLLTTNQAIYFCMPVLCRNFTWPEI